MRKVFLLTVPRRCFFCGSFLLVMLRIGVRCNVVSVLCSLVVTCWERADLLAVVFVVFCQFPKCVLVHFRIKVAVGVMKLVLALQLNIFTCRSKAVLFFLIICVLCFSCFRVCSLLPFSHLLALVDDVYCSFVTFPCGILG